MTTKTVTEFTTVHAVRFMGCGHITFMSDEHISERRRDHKTMYCSTCGRGNSYPGESDLEQLKRELVTVKDQRDTSRRTVNLTRAERDHFKASAIAHKGHHTRTKKRVSAGVCPCCNRTFQNLARHMANKHSNYAGAPDIITQAKFLKLLKSGRIGESAKGVYHFANDDTKASINHLIKD